jgi:hypothetical protein
VQDVIERQLKKAATKKQEIDHSLTKAEEVQLFITWQTHVGWLF